MATARAIANGNWSATSTWNGGILPGNGDTVYSNGFTVTIDQNVTIGGANNPVVATGSLVSGQWYEIVNVGGQSWTTIGASSNTTGTVFQASGAGTAGNLGTARALATLTTATNTAAGATTGGGGFSMPTVYTLTTDLRSGTTPCLTLSATSGTLVLAGIRAVGGSSVGAYAISITSNTGAVELQAGCVAIGNSGAAINNGGTNSTVTVSGACTFTGGTGGNFMYCLVNGGTNSAVTVSGACTFTGGGGGNSFAIQNASTGTITVSGACTFTGSSNGAAINNNAAGTITVSGACTFTGGSAAGNPGINNASTGQITVTNSTFTASAASPAVVGSNTGANVSLSGSFFDDWSGMPAIYVAKWKLGTAPTTAQHRMALAGTSGSYVTFFTADNSFGQANPTDVRSGVSYASGNLTGRLAIPARGTVSNGVNVGPSMLFTATRSGTTATATLAYSYPYSVGDVITVTGASNPEWNDTYTIASVVSGTSVTFTVPNTYSATTGGVANMQTIGTGVLTATDVTTAVNSAITAAVTATINPNVTTTINAAVPTAVSTALDTQWDKQTSTLTVAGSIGERLKNCATTQSTGDQLASLL